MLSTLDVSPAVRRANEVNFDRAEMIQDDKKRWALYIKPENQNGYSIYPDKEDVNRFFSTLKQAMDNIDKVRMELAHKYYALAEIQPDLKVDLFSTEEQDIDLNRIQRVSVFKTQAGWHLCVATIDGQEAATPQRHYAAVATDVGSGRSGRATNGIWRPRFCRCATQKGDAGRDCRRETGKGSYTATGRRSGGKPHEGRNKRDTFRTSKILGRTQRETP